ncbi:hypothetical protein K435DRAFT_172787 [Dendrothele bispora CBS 962.96]|uniref:Uncharacterized protein n=1 Tax=Dendrothele bispora (strain CBS 962.96) TaxID=1314807 RepID=A0A4S8MXP7_DENBC|nr:hypothetical protein K435DRAFT_172787 [Dendrothele bispora CBS 962.96]
MGKQRLGSHRVSQSAVSFGAYAPDFIFVVWLNIVRLGIRIIRHAPVSICVHRGRTARASVMTMRSGCITRISVMGSSREHGDSTCTVSRSKFLSCGFISLQYLIFVLDRHQLTWIETDSVNSLGSFQAPTSQFKQAKDRKNREDSNYNTCSNPSSVGSMRSSRGTAVGCLRVLRLGACDA